MLATLYAVEEDIDRDNYIKMPLIGNKWFLRDAIKISGNYDEIYNQSFGTGSLDKRGRNTLNKNGHPQLLEFPGLIE